MSRNPLVKNIKRREIVMEVIKVLGIMAFLVILFYALIGALFMHATKYDYEQSIKNCQELIKITDIPQKE